MGKKIKTLFGIEGQAFIERGSEVEAFVEFSGGPRLKVSVVHDGANIENENGSLLVSLDAGSVHYYAGVDEAAAAEVYEKETRAVFYAGEKKVHAVFKEDDNMGYVQLTVGEATAYMMAFEVEENNGGGA